MDIPSHQDWIKQTSAMGWRGKELEALDHRVLRYGQAVSDYGREWEANEIRIAFDAWKAKIGKDWKSSSRNKSRAFNKLDLALCQMGCDAAKAVGCDTAMAANLRQGTLYFLANCQSSLLPGDMGAFVNDQIDAGSDVHDLVQTARSQGVRSTAVQGSSALVGAKGEEASKGFLKSLYDSLKDYLTNLSGSAGEFAAQAVRAIVAYLPELLKKILGAVLQNLGNVVDIVKNLAKAGKAAIATFSTRNLEDVILSGHPRNVIHAVRDQIKDNGMDGVKDAVKGALLTGIGVANPIAGTICSAIASVYKFVTDLYTRYKDRLKLAALIQAAKAQLESRLYEDAYRFNKWFLEAIKDLPVLSSYCLCMPLTGSYFGFLTLIGTDGSAMSYSQLERNYAQFNDVKKWARKLVIEDKIRLESSNRLVAHSLACARQDTESQTSGGLKARLMKTVFGVVGAAA